MATFSTLLLKWHKQQGRKFVWMTSDPYDVWLSEVMLQQTQTSTIAVRFPQFKLRFPTIESLALASEEQVLAAWAGLGYYRRAKLLHKAAGLLNTWCKTHGQWPSNVEVWESMPGVGKSTAHAIVSTCFHQVLPILDANAKRVLYRVAGEVNATDKRGWELATDAMKVKPSNAAAYTQAIMDLGATVCTSTKPCCSGCPVRSVCHSRDNIPTKAAKPKTIKQQLVLHWDIFRSGTKVLLVQQPSKGIWASMWVFPEGSFVPGSEPVIHQLTHRECHLYFNEVSVAPKITGRWVEIDDICNRTIAVPTPIFNYLNG